MEEQDINEHIEKIKNYIKSVWDKGVGDIVWMNEENWPKILINNDETSPFLKVLWEKDGTLKIWPRKPIEFVSLTLTCPKDMKVGEFKEIVEDSVKELGEDHE